MNNTTKQLLIPIILLISVVGIFKAGILRALVLFILMGIIPGTNLSLSPEIMTGVIISITTLAILIQLNALLPRLVIMYRRAILRKKLLTIPAFRRQVRSRQA